MQEAGDRALLLSGRVVHVDGSARFRHLLLRDGRVVWLSANRPPRALLAGAREIVTGPRGWIFPGLVNLHTHSAYNVLPLWHSRRAPFANRFEWRRDPGYRAEVAGTLAELRKLQGSSLALAIVSELQAIAGGTAVLDQSNRLDDNAAVERRIVLCRDTGDPEDLGLPRDRSIDSIVDFFVPDDAGRPVPKVNRGGQTVIDAYAAARDAGRLGAALVHLAEGRSGSGSERSVDPYTRAEFEAFMAHPAMRDAAKVRRVPLTLVHASGIDVKNDAHLRFLVERNISVVWSPVSNLLLYGDTLDVDALIQSGLNVALGSDWSPSGSKHVWEEAKFARHFLAASGAAVSDAQIFRMVTANAGRCLNNGHIGRLEEGAFADLFILDSPIDSDSALEVFFRAEDRDVLATVINGVPVYGRRSFLRQFGLELQPMPQREGSAAVDKAVHLPRSLRIELGKAMDAVEDALKALDPPVKRSNLLASSDKPYQRRMQELRSRTEWFGWSVKQTTRRRTRGLPSMGGKVPVAPSSVRVWCGFMSGSNRAQFLNQLGQVFVPSTALLMRHLGLTAYFPGITPDDRPVECPDEVAIVFYESQKTYTGAGRSVGGRLYALLHQPVFRFGKGGSWSAFPVPLARQLRPRTAYHLFDAPIDWYGGHTRLHVGARDPAVDAGSFRRQLQRACAALRRRPGVLDGALLGVDDDYFVFWDHSPERRKGDDGHLRAFGRFSRTVMSRDATEANANGHLYEPWEGIEIRGGDCLRLRFERRALLPW